MHPASAKSAAFEASRRRPIGFRRGMLRAMPLSTFDHDTEARLLSSSAGCALVSVAVPGLPNTLLVQALVLPPLGAGSLHVVYREATMTFDAVAAFDPGDPTTPLADALLGYVGSADFAAVVLAPLMAEIRAHFGRRSGAS